MLVNLPTIPALTAIKNFGIHIYWDRRSKYFVAEIPEIHSCAADGATQAQAIANLEETFAVLKEAYVEGRLDFPKPNSGMPISAL